MEGNKAVKGSPSIFLRRSQVSAQRCLSFSGPARQIPPVISASGRQRQEGHPSSRLLPSNPVQAGFLLTHKAENSQYVLSSLGCSPTKCSQCGQFNVVLQWDLTWAHMARFYSKYNSPNVKMIKLTLLSMSISAKKNTTFLKCTLFIIHCNFSTTNKQKRVMGYRTREV